VSADRYDFSNFLQVVCMVVCLNCTDNGSLPRVISTLPMMRRSASSDAILSSYLYGRWPRLDSMHAGYYMKMQSRAVQDLHSQPRSFTETDGASSVLDQGVLEDIGVS